MFILQVSLYAGLLHDPANKDTEPGVHSSQKCIIGKAGEKYQHLHLSITVSWRTYVLKNLTVVAHMSMSETGDL